MSSVERSVLFPANEFRYPTDFDVARHRQFERMDEQFFEKGNHRFRDQLGNHGSAISPRQALMRYANSPAGTWHDGQTARYPVLHADLDPNLLDINDLEELSLLKHKILEIIAHPLEQPGLHTYHRYGHNGFDFHPIGHMAQVAMKLDRLLMLDDASDSIDPDPFLIQAIRHTAALHDVGETEFPGIKLHHGSAIGDIGADRGKTNEDRQLERAILGHVIQATFHDVYTDEFSEIVIALASHDTQKFDRQTRSYHAISELNHELNTLSTAQYLGKKGLEIATIHPMPANIMTALASDSILRGIKKRNHLKEEGLAPELSLVLTEKLRALFWVTADRDEDISYRNWRSRPGVEEKFGPFRPDSQAVRQALDED